MKGKRFLSVILVIVMIIEIISPMFFKEVLAVESTNNEMNSETTEETAEEQASEEQTNEEVSREYEIKEEETWDISENGDGSVIAKWTLSVKTLRISGNGKMRNWEYYNDREDWHSSQYTNIIEKLIIEDGVTNIGKNAFLECNNLNSIEMAGSIKDIEEDAFYGCSSLESIEIPEGVTKIGDSAFQECSSLMNIKIPKGVTSIENQAFSGCSSLTNIEIPKGVTSIEYEAFKGCSSLTSIEIPEKVTKIEESVFAECSSLENINVDINNRNYMSENGILFNKERTSFLKYPANKKDINEYKIPESITRIKAHAFEGCSSLTNIEIPEGVTEIGWYTFQGCSSLTSINIPKGVTEIGNYAFQGCSSLTNINIPKGVTEIGSQAFEECSSLANIEIPEGVTEIGWDAFSGCSSLINIKIPEGVTSIQSNTFEKCSSLINIEIPEGLTEISYFAFLGCSNLTSINIPESVTNIDELSFNGCSKLILYVKADSMGHKFAEENKKGYILNGEASTVSTEYEIKEEESWDISENGDGSVMAEWTLKDKTLTISGTGKMKSWNDDALKEDWHNTQYAPLIQSVVINEGITNIGKYAFQRCMSLINIEIPEGVTEIEEFAFYVCTSLKSVNIPQGVTSIERYAFDLCSNLVTIEIPESVTYIGENTFLKCSNLETINVDENNKNYMSENGILFNKERTILLKYPANKKDIDEYRIPESVTSIGERAFEECSILTSINIPKNITTIESYTFSGCSSLTNIEIPEGVTSIQSNTFEKCSSLINIEIPEGLTEISYFAFLGCSSLKNIQIPEGVITIKNAAFSGCSSLINVKIPEGITTISANIFSGCSSLTSVQIPESVKSIEALAFSECSSLTSIEIPEKVTEIGSNAFRGCSNIKGILLGENIINVGASSNDVPIIYTKRNSMAHKCAEENEQGYILDEKGPDINILTDRIITNQRQTVTIPVEVKDNYEIVGVKEGTIKYTISDSNTQAPSDEEFINDVIDGKITYEMQEGKKYIWIRAEDNLGNVATAVSEEFNLDTIAPQVEVSYSTKEEIEGNVTVEIQANEEIQKVEGWTISSDKKTLTKEYSENTEETVSVKDIAGNETTVQISIQNIIQQIKKGDINFDDKIDITDVILLKRHLIAENRTNWILTGDNLEAADMNENGKVDISDLLLLKREVAQNI